MLLINLIFIVLVIFLDKVRNRLINVRSILKNTVLFEFTWASFLFLFLILQMSIAIEQSEVEKSISTIINKEKAIQLLPIAVFMIIHFSISTYLACKLIRNKIQ